MSSSLSSSQQDTFDQLLSITSSTSEEDTQRDLRILSETGWNVQAAVEVIFSSPPPPTPSSSSSSAQPPISSSSSRTSGLPYSSFSIDDSQQSGSSSLPLPPNNAPPSSPGGGLGSRRTAGLRIPRGLRGITRVGMGIGWTLYSIILWPVGVLWGLLGGGWGWLVRALPPSIRNLLPRSILPTTLPPSSSSARPKGPATLIFLRSLEALTNARSPSSIGERSLASQLASSSSTTALLAEDEEEDGEEDGEERIVLPEFFIGKYKDALELAKKDARVLLVGLFSGVHQGDEAFKKTVLTDPLFVKTLKRHKVIFWAGDVRDREPYQVSRLLPPTTYPSLSFISLLPTSSPSTLRTSSSSSSSTLKLTILSRLEGPTTTSLSLTTTLEQSVLPRVATILARVQREKRLREEERRLRDDQDRAFRESEGRDLERIMKVRGEREREERGRVERVEREKEEGRKRERRIEYLRFARRNLIPEETGLNESTSTTTITLRLPPHPKPYKRRFPSTTPLEVLYLWADTLTLPDDLARAGDPEEPPTDVGGGYTHQFGFRLATSYPRKVVELGEGDGTVGGSEVLRVGAGVVVLERISEGGSGSGGAGGEEGSDESEEDGEGGSGEVEVSD